MINDTQNDMWNLADSEKFAKATLDEIESTIQRLSIRPKVFFITSGKSIDLKTMFSNVK